MPSLESINPATGDVIGRVDLTDPAEIPAIVERARQAQAGWAALDIDERIATLSRAGTILESRADELGELVTREMGKPRREAIGEARYAASSFAENLASIREALQPEVHENDRVRSTVHYDPLGVAACISPWNFPVLMPHAQLLPALAAGNAVIYKPSEHTPLTGQSFCDALIEVLPEDVLTVIHGADAQGKALVAAPVDLVVFTGSQEAGKHILGACSGALRRVILELGGKDPMVVLPGADVDAAAKFAARNSFRNAGQVCISTERIYVDTSLHDDFVERLAKAAATFVQGDGMEEGVTLGPMVDGRQRDHVRGQVDDAVSRGAKVAYRGQEIGGNYVAPVVLTDVDHDMRVMTEETFGPVACVMSVDGADEAVRMANDTKYGLGAVVFGPPDEARAVGRRLGAGMIGINQGLSSAGETPWVGAQGSGYGFHGGRDGHRQFTQPRVVHEPK